MTHRKQTSKELRTPFAVFRSDENFSMIESFVLSGDDVCRTFMLNYKRSIIFKIERTGLKPAHLRQVTTTCSIHTTLSQ